jgi:hypothetical protein
MSPLPGQPAFLVSELKGELTMSNLEDALERFIRDVDWASRHETPETRVDIERLAKDLRVIVVRLLNGLEFGLCAAGGKVPPRPPHFPLESVALAVALLQLADAGHH